MVQIIKKATLTTGVYVIRNLVNGKVYVGSTCSTFQSRWADHRKSLRGKFHANRHLQRAWDKYGEAAFEFSVLEECPVEKDRLLALEQYYIDLLKASNRLYGYNICPTAGSVLGLIRSDETKEKDAARMRKHLLMGSYRAKGSLVSWAKGKKAMLSKSVEERRKMSIEANRIRWSRQKGKDNA